MIFFHSNLLISSESSLGGALFPDRVLCILIRYLLLIRPLQPQLKLQVQLENHNLFNNDGETQNWISFNFWTSQHFQFILDFRMKSIYQFCFCTDDSVHFSAHMDKFSGPIRVKLLCERLWWWKFGYLDHIKNHQHNNLKIVIIIKSPA